MKEAIRVVEKYRRRARRIYKASNKHEAPSFTHYELHLLMEQLCYEIIGAIRGEHPAPGRREG
jgi:hypothetical protein